MAAQHKLSSMRNGVQVALGKIGGHYISNPLHYHRIVNVNAYHCLAREVLGNIGAAIIERHRPGQEAIGDFLTPIVGIPEVLYHEGVAIGGQPVLFVLDLRKAPSKQVK